MAFRSGSSVLPDEVYEKSLDCVHCGLCLTACPTYLATGRETSSPRGRIYLMRGVAEGRVDAGELLAEEAFLCLGCRACETACPSGVQYGAMLELTREAVDKAGLRPLWRRMIERIALRGVVPRAKILHWLFDALGIVQKLRLDTLVLKLLPERARSAHALLPEIPPREKRGPLPAFTSARGEKRGRVAVFVGCVMPELFGDINRATVRVLAANGFDVVVPQEQGCCGALQAHSGDLDGARKLARKNVQAFTGEGFDAVILNSAGCGAAMRECSHWLPHGEGDTLASLTRDISEFLDEVGLRAPGRRVAARVCYDDPCHLLHGQRVGDAPRKLLSQIVGLQLAEHAEPGACCGAAGIYNLTQPVMSAQVLERKLDSLAKADPDIIATGNPGCLMQLRAGAKARGLRARVVHPVELIDAAYSSGGEAPGASFEGGSVDYRSELEDDPEQDWWISATAGAFAAYNQPQRSREEQLAFVEALPTPLRHALVCLLYDGALNNGGVEGAFGSMGMLLPATIAGLSYYGLEEQSAGLRDIVSGLGLREGAASHDELMAAFDARYSGVDDELRAVESAYYTLAAGADLRAKVDERIRNESPLYFR